MSFAGGQSDARAPLDGSWRGQSCQVATRTDHNGRMEIVPLSRETWPALAELFAAGGDPKWCWCQFWRKPGSNWSNTTADDNRASLEALVGEDPAPGLVALRDGVAVGWVGLGPREAFGAAGPVADDPAARGRGRLVDQLLRGRPEGARPGRSPTRCSRAAVEYAADHGARIVEGYPVETEGRMPSASAYTGTRGMFDRAGFARRPRRPRRRRAGGRGW